MSYNIRNPSGICRVTGLNTYNFTASTAGTHSVAIECQDIPPSGITIQVLQNSVQQLLTAIQVGPVANANLLLNLAVGDIVSIVLASSTAQDQMLNSVKATINIHM